MPFWWFFSFLACWFSFWLFSALRFRLFLLMIFFHYFRCADIWCYASLCHYLMVYFRGHFLFFDYRFLLRSFDYFRISAELIFAFFFISSCFADASSIAASFDAPRCFSFRELIFSIFADMYDSFDYVSFFCSPFSLSWAFLAALMADSISSSAYFLRLLRFSISSRIFYYFRWLIGIVWKISAIFDFLIYRLWRKYFRWLFLFVHFASISFAIIWLFYSYFHFDYYFSFFDFLLFHFFSISFFPSFSIISRLIISSIIAFFQLLISFDYFWLCSS